MMTVYLAGHIAIIRGADGWRQRAADMLIEHGLTPINPHLREDLHEALREPRGILVRDHAHVEHADIVIAHLEAPGYPEAISIGTIMEIAWAWRAHKPIIALMSEHNIHARHPMIAAAITHRVETVDDAVMLACAVAGHPQLASR